MLLKEVLDCRFREFIYKTREERKIHIKEMVAFGWEEYGSVKKLKPNISIMDAKIEDYVFSAKFIKKEIQTNDWSFDNE